MANFNKVLKSVFRTLVNLNKVLKALKFFIVVLKEIYEEIYNLFC